MQCMVDEGWGHQENCFMTFNYCTNCNYMSSSCITYLNHFFTDYYALVKLCSGFLPFHFCGQKSLWVSPLQFFFVFALQASKNKRYLNSASILFCKAIQLKKSFLFSKKPAGFPHNLKWEKNPAGEIKVWN